MKYFRPTAALVLASLFIPFAFAHANMFPVGVPWYVRAAVFGTIVLVPTVVNAVTEALVGFVYVTYAKKPKSVLLWQLLANIITFVPFFIVFSDDVGNLVHLTVAEVAIVSIETCIIRIGARRSMRWSDALILSLLANITTITLSIFLIVNR